MITQQELESRLWAAANSLRGPVDPSDFKAYIFPLLFFKRISDGWDEEHARALADFGGDETLAALPENHRFQIPEGCHWRDLRRVHENVGVALQRMLDRIEEANPETLAGIFGDVAWGNKEKLPEHALLNLIEAFDSLDLSPSTVGHDVLGNAYEYLLKQFADESGKKAGEFFTPRSVVRLLTRILDPQPSETIYDPACGSGGMLVEAVNEMLEAGGSIAQLRLFGQEVNLTTAAIARMNLFLHDIEDVRDPPRRHAARPEVPRRPGTARAVRRRDREPAVLAQELGRRGLEVRPVGTRRPRPAADRERRPRPHGALRHRAAAEHELRRLGHQHPPAQPPRQRRRRRRRNADRARASGRAARRGPQDEPADRSRAVS